MNAFVVVTVVEVTSVVVVVVEVEMAALLVADGIESASLSDFTSLDVKGFSPPPSRLKPPFRSSFSIKRRSSCRFPDL